MPSSLASQPCRAGAQTWCVCAELGQRQSRRCRTRWLPSTTHCLSQHPSLLLWRHSTMAPLAVAGNQPRVTPATAGAAQLTNSSPLPGLDPRRVIHHPQLPPPQPQTALLPPAAAARSLHPQEDAHTAVLDLNDGSSKAALFAVLDGHGGAEVARFVANHLVRSGRRCTRCLGASSCRALAAALAASLAACCCAPAGFSGCAGLAAAQSTRCCCRHPSVAPPPPQAQELITTEGYRANDMEAALRQTYLRMDDLLVKASARRCARCAPLRHAVPAVMRCWRRAARAAPPRACLPASPRLKLVCPPHPHISLSAQEEHREELKSLRAKEEQEEGGDRCAWQRAAEAGVGCFVHSCWSHDDDGSQPRRRRADRLPPPSALSFCFPPQQRPDGDQRRLAA